LSAIAAALNAGNIARAQLVTLHLQFPNPPPLARAVTSHNELSKFIRELHWSGLIKAGWDSDQHPRWPAGTPDSQGGQFAPKDGGGVEQSFPSKRNVEANDQVAAADAPANSNLPPGWHDVSRKEACILAGQTCIQTFGAQHMGACLLGEQICNLRYDEAQARQRGAITVDLLKDGTAVYIPSGGQPIILPGRVTPPSTPKR